MLNFILLVNKIAKFALMIPFDQEKRHDYCKIELFQHKKGIIHTDQSD